eukprot:TRINITY_DN29301_c0_g1_i1.p3 TRINITY_DN29301_c0_g1~~TRINITY_DN29301_c0_g1_i1.p3  ORF type:complete len:285 (+),score=60.86 TRINITY_DN29301_c0_g1_i1:61-915(+)
MLGGVTALFVVFGTLGAVGALLLILTYALFPELRNANRKLLLYLSIADLLQALFFCVYLGDLLTIPAVCRVHTIVGVVAAAASFCWTVSISIHVVLVTILRRDSPIRAFQVVSWGLPVLLAVRYLNPFAELEFRWPFDANRIGWFVCVATRGSEAYEYSIPLALSWLITLVCYTLSLWNLRRFQPVAEGATDELALKFRLIPLLFIVQRAVSLFALTYEAVAEMAGLADPAPPMWTLYTRAVLDPVQGMLNALLFGYMSPSVRRRWLELLFGSDKPEEERLINH